MKVNAVFFSGLLKITAMIAVLFLVSNYTSIVNAAGGCGQGYHHSNNNGTGPCVQNFVGPNANLLPNGCWYNQYNQYRCPPGQWQPQP